jgi:hypothetical protein
MPPENLGVTIPRHASCLAAFSEATIIVAHN